MQDTWSVVTIVTIVMAFFAGGFVKGVIGLGMPTVALAVLASFLGLREALPFLIVPIILTNLAQFLQGGDVGPALRRFWLMNACAFATVWAGAAVLFVVNPLYLSGVLGATICVYVAYNLIARELSIRPAVERWLAAPVGLLAGLMMGMTGSMVFPLIPYLNSLGMDRDALVRALALAFLTSAVALGLALAGHGAIDARALSLSSLALVPVFAGMYAGRRTRGRLSDRGFRTTFYLGLLVLGANLVRKGFF